MNRKSVTDSSFPCPCWPTGGLDKGADLSVRFAVATAAR
ncbi:MAG: hypothetical protein QOE04_3744 [Mycobacterium sp.]|jgi:hypothetical protein|nr:hypothetical protein [Mycobacterium sp.]MDT5390103.1 hypothetical protein [Mycobacterium sp.]